MIEVHIQIANLFTPIRCMKPGDIGIISKFNHAEYVGCTVISGESVVLILNPEIGHTHEIRKQDFNKYDDDNCTVRILPQHTEVTLRVK